MIDAGKVKVTIKADGASHVRMTAIEESPVPGHLPRKLLDLAIDRDVLVAELKESGIIA